MTYTINDLDTALSETKIALIVDLFLVCGFLFILYLLFGKEIVGYLFDGIIEIRNFKINLNSLCSFLFFGSLIGFICVHLSYVFRSCKVYIISPDFCTVPASDMENFLIDIITFKPFRDLSRTRTIQTSQIQDMYLDTKRNKNDKNKTISIRYNLNITGEFGSFALTFTTRQKRDEVRNALKNCIKIATGKNIDKKVAEF